MYSNRSLMPVIGQKRTFVLRPIKKIQYMKKILKKFPALTSFLSIFFSVWGTYLLVSRNIRGATVVTIAIFGVAFLIGVIYGVESGREKIKQICLGASLAVLLLWAPIVVVTYGFALVALPVLAGFVGVVALGVIIGARKFKSENSLTQ